MAKTAFTAVKHSEYDRVLDNIDTYFSKSGLHLVEERIANKTGKYAKSPRNYKDLEEYDKEETQAYTQQEHEFSTNFDFFSNLKDSVDWCVLMFYPSLAHLTLNIDKNLTKYLSEQLNTTCIDYWENTVSGQMIIRSYNNGVSESKLQLSDGWEIDETEGYFEKLKRFDKEDITEEELAEKADIIDGFIDQHSFDMFSDDLNTQNKQTRRPMYLKGKADHIIDFLKKKEIAFFFV